MIYLLYAAIIGLILGLAIAVLINYLNYCRRRKG